MPAEVRSEILPRYVLHHQIGEPALVAGVHRAGDVLVPAQLGLRVDTLVKTVHAVVSQVVWAWHDLDGDLAMEGLVPCEVDFAHASGLERSEDSQLAPQERAVG
jgi:hypothetical protein